MMRRRDVLKGLLGVLTAGPSTVDVLRAGYAARERVAVTDTRITRAQLCALIEVTLMARSLQEIPSQHFDRAWANTQDYDIVNLFQKESR
jgi:hypothetical protein